MAERKPERSQASELLISTIETADQGAYTKLKELNKRKVTNMNNKGSAVSYRREN